VAKLSVCLDGAAVQADRIVGIGTAPLELPEKTAQGRVVANATSIKPFVNKREMPLTALCDPSIPFFHAEPEGDCGWWVSPTNQEERGRIS